MNKHKRVLRPEYKPLQTGLRLCSTKLFTHPYDDTDKAQYRLASKASGLIVLVSTSGRIRYIDQAWARKHATLEVG